MISPIPLPAASWTKTFWTTTFLTTTSLPQPSASDQIASLGETQRIMLINVVLVLALVVFCLIIILALARHSTRQRVAAARLAAMGTATGRLLHQVKNPLQTILLHAELLEDEYLAGDNESRQELCRAIAGEAARMADLLARLSTFATGVGQQLEAQPLALHEVVFATSHKLSHDFSQAGIQFEFGPIDEVVTAGDQVFLSKALENILRNAYEALAEGDAGVGRGVRVSLRRRGAGAIIEVQDNGSGIAEADLETIFEPFYSRKGSGLGLGLPLAREIVEGHGGRIEVRSRPGSGTSISLVLPIRTIAHPESQPA